jgi:epoxyqueuosine reductase
MGMYIYGCDRCQNVCPRNAAWLAQDLSQNTRVAAMAPHFDLSQLLHMDTGYFQNHIWPHMFYMGPEDIWRWKMNVARVMGNSLDRNYVPDLVRVFREHPDDRVRGMSAWALGRLGGREARNALDEFRRGSEGMVGEEIDRALERQE